MKIAILISGRGSNMAAILDRFSRPGSKVRPVLVLSDRADAAGLEIARYHDVPCRVISRDTDESRLAHEARIADAIEESGADLICLAGFMRILSEPFVSRFPRRILNIHPSLLPKFKGLDTHQRALSSNERQHGCTVHLVDQSLDGGPLIAQASVEIQADDTPETLAERVLEQEHRLYPAVIAAIATGAIRIEAEKIIVDREFSRN